MSILNTAYFEFRGRTLELRTDAIDRDRVTLKVRESPDGNFSSHITLPPPFRAVLDQNRVERIGESLLSHDFLLAKKIQRGGEVEFQVAAFPSRRVARLEAIVSLNQEAAVSAHPSEKVLPWILPRAEMSELYPFQREGVEWLLSADKRLLADDMGLGKTIQTIFGIRHGFSEHLFRNVLVLCPKSLVMNWLAELRKWAPELVSLAVSPPARTAEQVWEKALDNSHVAIANYEQVRESNATIEGRNFDLVVSDEAHRLRNATSQVAQGFKCLRHNRFWALTGTPIERDLKDLATLMSLLDEKRFSISDARTASAALREKAKPYILRRTKDSVLKDLPEVISSIESLELLEPQHRTYRAVQTGVGCNGDQIKNALHKLGELRRVCDYDPVSRSSVKLDRIHEELLAVKAAGEKAIVFSFVLEPLQALEEMTQKSLGAVMINGQMDGSERNQAIKRFRSDPTITSLYASSKVASEGLTLVEANHVFFINRWWNPSSNAQARDRVNRIGQKRCVFIHEYVCIGTVEEHIQHLLKTKGEIYDNVIGKLEDAILSDANIAAHLEGRRAAAT